MKMRLIDADKMRDDWLENGENEYVYETNAVLESIDAQPTVDAVEVVHGRWITEYWKSGYIKRCYCSECGEPPKESYKPDNYCPQCGAKMDRKDDT